MMVRFRSLWSSLVVQVTALTLAALLFVLITLIVVAQTPLAQWIFPRALSENAGSIAELVWLVESSPEELHPFILTAYQSGGRFTAISAEFADGLTARPAMAGSLSNAESEVAARLLGRDIRFQSLGAIGLQRRLAQQNLDRMSRASALHIAIELKDERVLNVWLAPTISLARGSVALIVLIGIVALFAIALGLAIASVMLRPIRRLEQDAENVELGAFGGAVTETGPLEMRRLTAALNRLRDRLSGLIREREQIIAAIAHDVRTGLTRIRLRMDAQDQIAADEIEGDLSQMEALISDMLAYARAESPIGQQELLGLKDFVETLATDFPHKIKLLGAPADDFVIAGDPVALRRLFENLIENARRYGGGEITVRFAPTADGLEICIDDNGDGLPEDQLESLFEPFQRGEASRNRATGGTGLGLGIARAIARAHGASLRLENRVYGGLSAIVHFPDTLRT